MLRRDKWKKKEKKINLNHNRKIFSQILEEDGAT